MSFQSWRQNARPVRSLRAVTHRPILEVLEDRLTPSFNSAASYAVGANPQAVVTGYFNNDTVLDLAVANNSDSTVSVLLGNANGTFNGAVNYATGSGPLSVAVGDLNSDGNPDLATANAADVSVLLGNGDGTFGTPIKIDFTGLGSNPSSVAVGDFNGDGKMDLGVTSNVYIPGYYGPGYWGGYYGNYYYPGTWYPGYNEGRASLLLGNGSGGFSEPNTTSLSYGSHVSAAVADFNGDAIDDFATANSESGTVSVLLGDPSGYLQSPNDFAAGYYPYAVTVADVDGDLDADLVTANFAGNDVGVLLGNGAGGFGAPNNYAAGEYPFSIVVGDFTHDGKLDIATANVNANQVSVLYGVGDGTFGPTVTAATGTNPWGLAAGDFNHDGWLDAATANYGGNDVSVLLNNQDWRAFHIFGYPSTTIVGETHTITVKALDNSGNVLTGYTGTVHFGSSDPIAGLPGDYTFLPSDNGTATFNVTLNTVGAQSISVHDTSTPTILGSQTGIVVNPPPPATLSIDDVTVTEGDGVTVAAVFTVTRGSTMSGTVTVNYSTANGGALAGSDYVAQSGTLTFGPGETTKFITILVNGDLTDEYDQGFFVNLSAATGANITDSQGVGTILDNDPPPTITITAKVSANEGNNNSTTTFNFFVTLSALSEKEVQVNFATANGTASTADNDYVAKSGTLIFAPGQNSKTISVVVRGDKRKEPTETFSVNLTGAKNATILTAQGIGEIVNDDTPPNGGKR